MSGRAVWFRDGDRVTGFRKTDRRNPRAARAPLPWVLSFEPPPQWMLAAGAKLGLIGVSIGIGGHVEITGIQSFVLDQAATLVRKVGFGWSGRLTANLRREAETGPAISAPARPAVHKVVELEFNDGGAWLRAGQSIRKIGR